MVSVARTIQVMCSLEEDKELWAICVLGATWSTWNGGANNDHAELPKWGADPATVGHAQKTPAIEQLKRDVVLDGAVPPIPS